MTLYSWSIPTVDSNGTDWMKLTGDRSGGLTPNLLGSEVANSGPPALDERTREANLFYFENGINWLVSAIHSLNIGHGKSPSGCSPDIS